MKKLSHKKIVCLGGGIGTVNLVRGLKKYYSDITVIISMADEGGSSGRLRRLYDVFPPGDLVSCMAALAKDNSPLSKLLTYRFPGDRYGKDDALGGHKLGNLMLTAATNVTGDFNKAVALLKKVFAIEGELIPATDSKVSISAKTVDGLEVFGEENIDLGKYDGRRILEKVYLHPKDIKANQKAVQKLENADVIIAGPGDLYTTVLPSLIVPEISKAITQSKAIKFFVVNVANKPFETNGYKVVDYIDAVKRHMKVFPFKKLVVNTNFSVKIPKKYHYAYVKLSDRSSTNSPQIILKNLICSEFPLYHDSSKLAKAIVENI